MIGFGEIKFAGLRLNLVPTIRTGPSLRRSFKFKQVVIELAK
jgi:hypothetical protein